MERQKLAEGKTKIIWPTDRPGIVDIQSKDDITAGDGERHDVITGKAALATATTSNCFALLETRGVPTHFLNLVNPTTFRAHQLEMLPIECVARRIATGSYLKRNLNVAEGTIFKDLVLEFFFKDDSRHDPMMIWRQDKDGFDLFDAKLPLGTEAFDHIGYEAVFPGQTRFWWYNAVPLIRRRTTEVFEHLEVAWAEQAVALVDLKVEYGIAPNVGQTGLLHGLILGDVVDNDSWRIWPAGDKTQMKDKQVYRDSKDRTPKELGKIKENYAWVAEATSHFLPKSAA